MNPLPIAGASPAPLAQSARSAEVPARVRIEAFAGCQLSCPSCPTASGEIRPAIRGGYLRADAFARFLDEHREVRHVELSNYGEMFLNPELPELLGVAHERGVKVSADNGVNLNRASPEALEAVVRYGVTSMTCSIDGATSESYRRYRRGGELESVLANIRTLNRYKEKHRSRLPALTWQLVVFGHNEHEIEAARALASSLGMRFKPKISWDDAFSPVVDPTRVRREAGLPATRAEYREEYGLEYVRPCHQLWNEPVMNWDGTVLGCCRNFWGDFGKGGLDDLSLALSSEKMATAKAMLLGERPSDAAVPCSSCDVYLAMQRSGRYLTLDEVRWKARARAAIGALTRLSPRATTELQRWLGRGRVKRVVMRAFSRLGSG